MIDPWVFVGIAIIIALAIVLAVYQTLIPILVERETDTTAMSQHLKAGRCPDCGGKSVWIGSLNNGIQIATCCDCFGEFEVVVFGSVMLADRRDTIHDRLL